MLWNRCGNLKYEVDYDDGVIRNKIFVDGREISLPPSILGQKYTAKKILCANGYYGKMRAKNFLKEYAVPASRVASIANAGLFKATIKPYMELSSLFYQSGRKNDNLYLKVVKNWDLIQEVNNDGLKNILPFIAYLGKTPQQLRNDLGKGLWKKVCANSYSRNILLAQKVNGQRIGLRQTDNVKPILQGLIEIPSTALRVKDEPDAFYWAARAVGVPLKKAIKGLSTQGSDIRKMYDLARDTKYMLQTMRLPFSLNWSVRRMKEEHDSAMGARAAYYEAKRIASDAKYAKELEKAKSVDLSKKYKTTSWEHDEVRVNLLTTFDSVKNEGDLMHHCVGSYAMRVANGDYLVLHIECGSYKSTCGLERIEDGWRFGQHYGVCNDPNVPESHRKAADEAMKSLNKMEKELNEERN